MKDFLAVFALIIPGLITTSGAAEEPSCRFALMMSLVPNNGFDRHSWREVLEIEDRFFEERDYYPKDPRSVLAPHAPRTHLERTRLSADDPLCARAEAYSRFVESSLAPAAQAWAEHMASEERRLCLKTNSTGSCDGPGMEVLHPLSQVRVSPWIEDVGYPGASYDYAGRQIQVTRGLLELFASDMQAAHFVMAHELGHGVQFALGFHQGFYSSISNGDRWFEAQADAWSMEILTRAGFAADTLPRGSAQFLSTWSQIPFADPTTPTRPGRPHPPTPVRFINALLTASLPEGTVIRQEDFLEDGRLVLPEGVSLGAVADPSGIDAAPNDSRAALFDALLETGNLTRGANRLFRRYLQVSAFWQPSTVEEALGIGIMILAPTEQQRQNTLRFLHSLNEDIRAGQAR